MSEAKEKKTWECPVCHSNAYQRYGAVPLPAKKIDGRGNETETTVKFGGYFQCKGCSLHFSNPNLFNAANVAERQLKHTQQTLKGLEGGLFDSVFSVLPAGT